MIAHLRRLFPLFALVGFVASAECALAAQPLLRRPHTSTATSVSSEELEQLPTQRIDSVERLRQIVNQQGTQIRQLEQQLSRVQANQNGALPGNPAAAPGTLQAGHSAPRVRIAEPVHEIDMTEFHELIDTSVAEYLETTAVTGGGIAAEEKQSAGWESGYDGGFFIRPVDTDEGIPFDLLIKGRMQFRHTGFKTDDEDTSPDRNDFEVERGRLYFIGHFIDPKLRYYLQLDADDDDNFNVKFHDFYLTYACSEECQITVGKWKVPGSRDWLQSSNRLRFADRSLATTFFRPDRTTGVWFHGKTADDLNYRIMVGNGFWTTDMKPSQIDDQFGFAGSLWWDPFGDYGRGYSDLEWHENLVARVGTSFTFSDMNPTSSAGELARIRLNDTGKLITDAFPDEDGAAAGYDIYVWALDAAFKCHGWSANAEYFFRWLQDFEGSDVPVSGIFDHGFYAEAGYMLIPERLEAIGRISRIIGEGGEPTADEYAGGFNWFVKGHSLKVTFDVSVLDGAPASNSSPGYVPGMDGVLFRTQVEAGF